MAGAGVTPDVIRLLFSRTKIACFHLSARKILESGMEFRRRAFSRRRDMQMQTGGIK